MGEAPVKNPRIVTPDMCKKHQSLLVRQCGIGPKGPWQTLIVLTQVALLRATLEHPETRDKVSGDVTRIHELGCLACFRPDAFGVVVDAFQRDGFEAVKRLGLPFNVNLNTEGE